MNVNLIQRNEKKQQNEFRFMLIWGKLIKCHLTNNVLIMPRTLHYCINRPHVNHFPIYETIEIEKRKTVITLPYYSTIQFTYLRRQNYMKPIKSPLQRKKQKINVATCGARMNSWRQAHYERSFFSKCFCFVF